ncbi:hypothetical protein GQ44DRAFT_728040 [Phaeosphaeriaceae sp. PMI808]|nr:hypothetical protein GQ44DRAFT_728040 [Phaeosphaeriaceae sp. PMI808]
MGGHKNNFQWEPVEGFEIFTELTLETFERLYGDVIEHKFEAKDLPIPHKLLPIEKEIWSERELEQDPLKRHILPKVNSVWIVAYKYVKTKNHSKEFDYPPAIVCGTKEPSGGPVPGWIGKQTGCHALLCGETKLSTVFKTQNIINMSTDDCLQKPVEQYLYYCIIKSTRYGFVVTNEELVVLRIHGEELENGIASQRPRRTVPSPRYSLGSSPLASSTLAIFLYSNSKPQRSPKGIEYRVIKWSAKKGLTVCLSLFWLTLMVRGSVRPIRQMGRLRNKQLSGVQKDRIELIDCLS